MSLKKMKLIFAVCLIVYHRNAEGLNQNYVDIQTWKMLSEHFSNITTNTLLGCAGECTGLVPKGTCNLAAFNKSSNNCLLGSQGNGQIQDVLDENSVVMVFYEMCGVSESPLHGSVVYSANRETAQFTCDPGYYLSGNTFIPCNNGTWVGTLPICFDLDECGSNPCLNGATCVNGIGMYACKCAAGFAGMNCEIDSDECGSNPCQNGATCFNGIGVYTCTCAFGFTGTNCEIDINECGSIPCMNGATCINGIGVYACTCAVGFTGMNCEIDLDECGSNPCLNGATCVNGIGMYTCTCAVGFMGITCEIDIDECGSSPCLNGATCFNGVGMYTCTCPVGIMGMNCEIVSVQGLNYDCCDVRANNPSVPSGIYHITMMDNTVIPVYCDMDTTCGGWTVIQNRFDGSVNFTETFFNYEFGFGSIGVEHWLGLRYIQEIAAQAPTTLRIDLEAADLTTAYEEHTNFFLSPSPDYILNLDSVRTGTAGYEPGMGYNLGQSFYTIDRDNTYGCAQMDYGGWWYTYCAYDNLNGRYMPPGDMSLSEAGVTYRTFRDVQSLKRTKMMISRCNICV